MAATNSVKIEKTFSWKQDTRVFSNRYHFNGGTPANDTAWHTFMDAVVAAEKAIYSSEVTIVAAVGYVAGSDMPVSSKTYTTAGTLTPPTNCKLAPGECVALLRWATAARSSKNHPVYLFNYFHGVYADYVSANEQDLVAPAQSSAIDTYAGSWLSGFSDGSHTLVRAGPNGANATGHQVDQWITHRDFPR